LVWLDPRELRPKWHSPSSLCSPFYEWGTFSVNQLKAPNLVWMYFGFFPSLPWDHCWLVGPLPSTMVCTMHTTKEKERCDWCVVKVVTSLEANRTHYACLHLTSLFFWHWSSLKYLIYS
jgi:hypothetical protein